MLKFSSSGTLKSTRTNAFWPEKLWLENLLIMPRTLFVPWQEPKGELSFEGYKINKASQLLKKLCIEYVEQRTNVEECDANEVEERIYARPKRTSPQPLSFRRGNSEDAAFRITPSFLSRRVYVT